MISSTWRFEHKSTAFGSRRALADHQHAERRNIEFWLGMDPAEDETDGAARTPTQPQRPRSSIPSFLFITFLLFMLTSHSGDEFLARNQYQNALQSLNYQLGNFTAWINGTASEFVLVRHSHIPQISCVYLWSCVLA